MEAELYERIILTDDVKQIQIRLTINEFRGIEYLHLRKYYMDFDEEWKPSSEGISFAVNIENSKELFIGLVEILSLAESKQLIFDNFTELLRDLYS